MKPPKFFETILFFYPTLQTGLIAASAIWFVRTLDPEAIAILVFVSYLLSPLLWMTFKALFGSKTEGSYFIGKRVEGGNLWLLSYQLQSVYSHFAVFERVLKILPGFYSAWLRLWGSKIGRRVNWTPECQVVDRGHLQIGDRAFIGNRSYFSAHAIKKSKDRYVLFVKGISIGDDAMISYAVHVGPGVVIGSRAHIDAGAELYPNTQVNDGESFEHERVARI